MKNSDNPIEWKYATPKKGDQDGITEWNNPGLTKREYFAGLALQGFLANRWAMEFGNYSREDKVKEAVELADELLKQLEPKD